MRLKFFLTIIFLLVHSLTSTAASFSVSGAIDGSSSYSVSVDGVTMSIYSNGGGTLTNDPHTPALDFGFSPVFGLSLQSLDISFSETVLLSGLSTFGHIALEPISITLAGYGIEGSIDLPENPPGAPVVLTSRLFSNGPLLLQGGLSYSVDVSPFGNSDMLVTIDSFEASTVPIPAAAWLFGSALVGLVGVKRKK